MSSDGVIKIGDEEFEEAPRVAVLTSKWLVEAWDALGRPETPLTESGQKMMELIITTWQELFPDDAKEWLSVRNTYKINELSLTEQVHQRTGRSLASYPFPVYQMMKRIFPNFKASERENCIKMVRKFPMFKFANKV